MATTNKGIYYPNNYSNVADVPEDMKKLAESVDTVVGNLDTNKVDKVDGKGLSTNDYTNEDKAKLDSLENYDDTEITQEIEDIQAKDESQDTEIDKQSDLIQKLKDNSINVTTEEATQLQVQDASTVPAKLEVRGNHSQETREGYNIWDYLSAVLSSAGGLTIEKDYENGYITVNGMPSKDYVSIVSTAYITNLLEDGQRYTLWQENYQNEETAGIYLQVARTDDNGTTRYYSLSNSATFLVDKSNHASYSIILQTSTVANTKTLSNYKNRYMLYKGTDEKTYELPGASPSLDYPSEVRAVGDNVNILPNNAVSKSVGGVNWTVNADGSVDAVGTATSNSTIDLITTSDEIFNFKKGIAYKNVGNVDICYQRTDGDYGRFLKGAILELEEDMSVSRLYLQVNSGVTVDETYYPKIVEYYEGIDESYSPHGQGSVEIIKNNKNMAKIDNINKTITSNGITVSIDDEGVVTLNGTATASFYINLYDLTANANSGYRLPKGNYKAFFELLEKNNSQISESNGDIHFYYRNRATSIEGTPDITYADFVRIIQMNEEASVKEMEITEDTIVSYVYVTSGVVLDNLRFRFAIFNENETDTTYEKHEESNYTLPIQQPMMKGDYFVKEADGWKEVHTFGYVNTREVENLGVSLNTSNGEFRRYNAYNLVTDRKSGEYLKILCTHFKRIDSRWHENEGICGWETGQSFCIGTFNTNYDTVDRMKTFLQNNDVGIYYELATPTKLPCTEEQSAILDQLNNLELYKGTNNIITAESLALMQMQYIADTETYIDNRIDEKLANINQQILELAGGN